MKIGSCDAFPGSAGCQPAMLGSLPSMIFVGKLPTNAGWQPALPGVYAFQLGACRSLASLLSLQSR